MLAETTLGTEMVLPPAKSTDLIEEDKNTNNTSNSQVSGGPLFVVPWRRNSIHIVRWRIKYRCIALYFAKARESRKRERGRGENLHAVYIDIYIHGIYIYTHMEYAYIIIWNIHIYTSICTHIYKQEYVDTVYTCIQLQTRAHVRIQDQTYTCVLAWVCVKMCSTCTYIRVRFGIFTQHRTWIDLSQGKCWTLASLRCHTSFLAANGRESIRRENEEWARGKKE